MKGATADDWARMMNTPANSMRISTGISQYFLRARRKLKNSRTKDISPLELLFHCAGGRSRRYTSHPIRIPGIVAKIAHRVLLKKAADEAGRSKYEEEQDGHDNGLHDPSQDEAQATPSQVRIVEEPWLGPCDESD